MKKTPTPRSATITALSHEGRGIAHVDGKMTFIDNALPNETVDFIYTKRHRSFDEGEAIYITQPSPERLTPPCPHFAVCGGCSLQQMQSEMQLAFKQAAVLEQIRLQSGITPHEILPPLTGALWHYRRRARLSVKYLEQKKKLLMGFHQKNGRFIAELHTCLILDERVSRHFEAIRALLESLDVRAQIPQLEIACGDEKCALLLRHLAPLSDSDIEKLRAFDTQCGFEWYLQPGGVDSIHPINAHSNPEKLFYMISEYHVRIHFNPADFTQINAVINQKMVHQALTLLDLQPDETVLDLFCGLGNFSLAMAKQCARVIGIEGDRAATERATQNARQQNIQNVTFYAMDLSKGLNVKTILHNESAYHHRQKASPITIDKILLDPPRTGALSIAVDLSMLNAKRIVYVSCNPATLARDTRVLVEQGYTLTHVGIMDMFPHTRHVEAMAVFAK